MKKFVVILIFVAVVVLGVFIAKRMNLFQSSLSVGQQVVLDEKPDVGTNEQDGAMTLEMVVSGLDTPWSIVFTSPERMLVTERSGKLRVIENGQLLPMPLHIFTEVSEQGEEGLLSLALDQEYPQNHFIYVALTYPVGGVFFDKVMRFRDTGTELVEPFVVIDQIPAAKFHAGSRIAFGPDGNLYITTGDATDKNLAQDKASLAGKILRLNKDGSIPKDNPFPNNPVWSYGHRNPQGIAWHPDNGEMYATEHGPSGFDGPGGGDEVNLIEKGANYGWPLVSHEEKQSGTEAPLITFTPAEAPASLLIYSGRAFPAWRGHLFFGALKGEGLMRLVLDESDPQKIKSYEKLKMVDFGRIRDVIEGPDGLIYFSTSNRDGRGKPSPSDDRIFRIRLGVLTEK